MKLLSKSSPFTPDQPLRAVLDKIAAATASAEKSKREAEAYRAERAAGISRIAAAEGGIEGARKAGAFTQLAELELMSGVAETTACNELARIPALEAEIDPNAEALKTAMRHAGAEVEKMFKARLRDSIKPYTRPEALDSSVNNAWHDSPQASDFAVNTNIGRWATSDPTDCALRVLADYDRFVLALKKHCAADFWPFPTSEKDFAALRPKPATAAPIEEGPKLTPEEIMAQVAADRTLESYHRAVRAGDRRETDRLWKQHLSRENKVSILAEHFGATFTRDELGRACALNANGTLEQLIHALDAQAEQRQHQAAEAPAE